MGKWYDAGHKDAMDGMSADPPWNPGHRDHTAYMEGWTDGDREAARLVELEDAASRERDYKVVWVIDIYANSPEDAARKARATQLNPHSIATCFEVTDGDSGEMTEVDLDD